MEFERNIDLEMELGAIVMKYCKRKINASAIAYSLLSHASGISLINFQNEKLAKEALIALFDAAFKDALNSFKYGEREMSKKEMLNNDKTPSMKEK